VTSPPEIIGIMLVHNEDRFLRLAVRNIVDFCDRILIADHQSTDGTVEIAQELARTHPKIQLHQIKHPRESNELLHPYAGTNTWVFGVDGDEIYDPAGLAAVRAELARGMWKEWWVVFGNVLNCVRIDEAAKIASGYQAPPCRSMTKLYNFAAVESLDPEAPQRLMGRNDQFKPGFDIMSRYELYKTMGWEEAQFRCLHACFLRRSTVEKSAPPGRENLTEMNKHSALAWLRRRLAHLTGGSPLSSYKQAKYMRGPLVSVDATPFLP
jgi:glycosyltransferase involved in cell wall biosynthesis